MVDLVNLHHVHDIQLWLSDRDHVYIGRKTKFLRGSKWGNPYIISKNLYRKQAVQRYNTYLSNNQELLQSLPELRGKTLGCWCVPRLCHGHIIKQRLVDSPTSNSVPSMASFQCETCGKQFPNTVDLQFHQISCGNMRVVRKSGRKRSQTTRYAEYTQKLLVGDSEDEEQGEGKEVTSKGKDMERAVETKEGKEGKGKLEECEEGKSVKDPEVQVLVNRDKARRTIERKQKTLG